MARARITPIYSPESRLFFGFLWRREFGRVSFGQRFKNHLVSKQLQYLHTVSFSVKICKS